MIRRRRRAPDPRLAPAATARRERRGAGGPGRRAATWLVVGAAVVVLAGCGAGTDPGRAPTGAAGASRSGDRATRAAVPGGRITRVVDGDTVHVRTRGGDETVRLALVDAPETSTTRYGRAECGGAEAAALLERLVDGRDVSFRRPGGEERDRFGRAVAELLVDGRSVDDRLVAAGWARPFRVPSADGGAAANRRVRGLADEAREDRVGVWRLCGGFGRGAD